MEAAAERKAEGILIRELRAAGLTEKAFEGSATKRAAQMEDRLGRAHGNYGVARMDRAPARPQNQEQETPNCTACKD